VALDETLVDRVATKHPSPIADAVIALVSAESPHERRDRIVEAFRALLRYLSAIALGARLGRSPGGEEKDVRTLIEGLRKHALTDGQWWHMLRELVRPWRDRAKEHPLPALVELVASSKFGKDIDALLGMRKSETVAHGTTGDREIVDDIVGEREPVLARLLDASEALFVAARLVVPLTVSDGAQPALALVGATPARGRNRRISLGDGVRVDAGRCILVDPAGMPIVSVEPIVRHAAPSPGALPEVFFLDGRTGRGAARYVSLPSANERVESSVWDALEGAFASKADADTEAVSAPRPYRGLARFESRDAELFFGRDDEIQALANRIRAHGMVTVTGPSGSGKSSLLAAGVVPALGADGGLYREGARRGARVFLCRPGRDPARELSRALDLEGSATAEELTARLTPADGSLAVLIIDQAEELLTLASREAAVEFAELLAQLGGSDSGPTRIVLSMREDFFAQLARLAPLVNVYDRHVMVLGPLDREAMLRTLVEPARRFGVEYEPGLAEQMVDALGDRAGALPLLQFTADQMWERRGARVVLTRGVLDEIGGVEGALARHADATLDAMVPSMREVARQMMLRLVTPEGTRSTVRRDELEAIAIEAPAVVAALESARLLAARQDGDGAAVCELVHEALLQHWPRLKEWRHAEGEGAAHVALLAEDVRAWRRGGKRHEQLWHGDVLAEHRRWRERAKLELTADEREFVNASFAYERRVRRRRFAIIAAVGAVLTAIALVAGLQWRAAVASEHKTLAALAQAEIQGLLVRAREYKATGHTAEEMAVLRVLAQKPDGRALAIDDGFIWKAHQRQARVLGRDVGLSARSSDGTRFMATVPGAIVMWEAATGKELARMAVKGSEALEFPELAAFSPMGKYVIVATCAGTGKCPIERQMGTPESWADTPQEFGGVRPPPGERLELRELATGAAPFAWDHDHPLQIGDVVFATDDSAYAVRHDGKVDVIAGGDRRSVEIDCKGPLAVSAGGRVLAAICDDGGISVVTAEGAQRKLTSGKTKRWFGAAFLDDRRLLATGNDGLAMWGVDDGKRIGSSAMPQVPPAHKAPRLDWRLDVDGRVIVTDTGLNIAGDSRTVLTGIVEPRAAATIVHLPVDGQLWGVLVVRGDRITIGPTADQMPPWVAPVRRQCLPVMGRGERSVTALDGGARIVEDEQELPANVDANIDFGMLTIEEIPVRWWRPSKAIDNGGCEVWETKVPDPLLAEQPGIDIQALSDSGYGVNHQGDQVTIVDVRTGTKLRTATVPESSRRPYWVLGDVAAIPLVSSVVFVPVDPAAKVIEIEDPSEFHGVPGPGAKRVWMTDDKETSIYSLADGSKLAHFPDPDRDTAGFLPDGSIIRVASTGLSITTPKGDLPKLPRAEEVTEPSWDFDGTYFVGTGKHVLVWNLNTKQLVGDLGEAHDADIVNDEVWAIPDKGPAVLRRWNIANKTTRDVTLSETSLPYHGPAVVHPTSDGKMMFGSYNIANDAYNVFAMWDATTGALVWLGQGDTQVFANGLVCDGRAFNPDLDIEHLLASTGARTNLRVCPRDYRAVPVFPPPAPDTVWAPPSACAR
jgi:hypothetical protein